MLQCSCIILFIEIHILTQKDWLDLWCSFYIVFSLLNYCFLIFPVCHPQPHFYSPACLWEMDKLNDEIFCTRNDHQDSSPSPTETHRVLLWQECWQEVCLPLPGDSGRLPTHGGKWKACWAVTCKSSMCRHSCFSFSWHQSVRVKSDVSENLRLCSVFVLW